MSELREIRSFIAGEPASAHGKERLVRENPATGQPSCEIQVADDEDVDRAVQSCSRAQKQWARTPIAERARVLGRAAALLRERNDELARLEVLDTGKPIAEASSVDVTSAADCLEFFAGVAATLHGEHIDLGESFAYTRREPLGVCAGIGAWNYPLQIAAWKSAPALACGNAMIFKPSELTPTTTVELAAIYIEAGLPAGVFNVVHGGAAVGRALCAHPGIAKVSLTGEASTGRKVMASAAGTLKHVTLELGGKSPLVIFGDADIDNAVSAAMMANFYTQGEICSNGTRVFVAASIYDRLCEALVERTSRLRIGDPLDPGTEVGALISAEHADKVVGYITRARGTDARLLCGGERSTGHGSDNFVEPTVFADVDDGAELAREEVFGPVMAILRFDDDDEDGVIERANDTPYGLAAGVFTRDLARAHRVAARLEAGICWINNYNLTPIEVPFGGVKQSGLGRENGVAAIEHYSQRKTVYVELGDVDCPYPK